MTRAHPTGTPRQRAPAEGALTPGPQWDNFEALRASYAQQLARLPPQCYGVLKVKRQRYALIRLEDLPPAPTPRAGRAAELLEVAQLSVASAIARSEDASLEVARKSLRMLEAELRRQGVIETTDAPRREP